MEPSGDAFRDEAEGIAAPALDERAGSNGTITEAGTPSSRPGRFLNGGNLLVESDAFTAVHPRPGFAGEAPSIGLHRPTARIMKRAIDLVLGSILFVLATPLLLLIAIAIRMDSPGPVIFRAWRVGRNGKTFRMLKFRSMIRDADRHKLALMHLNEAGEGRFKIERDPRVTRFGRLLRATGLDELPQIVQVLTGTMSLVGPRPLPLDEDPRIEGADRVRLTVRPGLTGPWQVAGSWRISLADMAVMDRDYIENWSVGRDLKLLAQTIAYAVGRDGA